MKALAPSINFASTKASARRRLIGCGIGLLSAGVALVSFRYLLGKGPVPDNIAANRFVDPWIVVHATSAATTLLLGPIQFLRGVRQRWPALHRLTGRLYVLGCLSAGVSALVLAAGLSAGAIAALGFGALGTAWMVTTGIAVRHVLAGDIASHERWMVRSFALTFSAVTLRLYLPLSIGLGIDFLPAYRAIAWACWVPNLLIAEWYLGRQNRAAE